MTRTIFKLGGPDFVWYKISIIPKVDTNSDNDNDYDDHHNDDDDDEHDEDQNCHNSANFQARRSRFCMV